MENEKATIGRRFSVKLSDALAGRLTRFCTVHNISESEVLHQALYNYLPKGAGGPSDPELREVYCWLRERTDYKGKVDAQEALSGLAQTLSIAEEFVRKSRLGPLRQKNWIKPTFGTIHVVEPSERRESEAKMGTEDASAAIIGKPTAVYSASLCREKSPGSTKDETFEQRPSGKSSPRTKAESRGDCQ